MKNNLFDQSNASCLLIGVGRRPADSEAMAVSATDALTLGKALRAFGIFTEAQTKMVVEEAASRQGILDALDHLIAQTKMKPADLVLIFFSGHGSGRKDKYHLICRDTSSADLDQSAISGDLFLEKLQAIQTDKMLLLLDCCHAEGIADPMAPLRLEDSAIPFEVTDLINRKNRVVLTACARSQVSYLSKPVSVFTYAVIEALGGRFLTGPEDKEVNVFNLSMDVRERVVALASQVLQVGTQQQPQLSILQKAETRNFGLAYHPKGGPRELRFFTEAFGSLTSQNGKDLDMAATGQRDEEERRKYEWLSTANISLVQGSNNVTTTGTGNTVNVGSTIQTGLSGEDLIKLAEILAKKNG